MWEMGNLENEPRGIRSKCIERKINRKAEEEGDPRTSRIRRVSSDIGAQWGKIGERGSKKARYKSMKGMIHYSFLKQQHPYCREIDQEIIQ